jgi:hypothetical protein
MQPSPGRLVRDPLLNRGPSGVAHQMSRSRAPEIDAYCRKPSWRGDNPCAVCLSHPGVVRVLLFRTLFVHNRAHCPRSSRSALTQHLINSAAHKRTLSSDRGLLLASRARPCPVAPAYRHLRTRYCALLPRPAASEHSQPTIDYDTDPCRCQRMYRERVSYRFPGRRAGSVLPAVGPSQAHGQR